MRVRFFAAILAAFMTAFAAAADTTLATGVVFHDKNGNGERDPGEPGVAGVLVSNGEEVVTTDAEGRYTLPVTGDTIIFVNKPRGWQVPIEAHTQLPRFYYIHKPAGSPELRYPGVAPTGPLPESVDFPLTPYTTTEAFKVVVFGDTQPRDQAEVDYIAHRILPELAGTDALFGVTLGDIVFDDLSLFEPLNNAIGLIGVPWYNVIGNHDINFDAPTTAQTSESFQRVYGPPYYAFNYGKVWFLNLDNIHWNVGEENYHGEMGARQLRFVENLLEHVSKDHLVVAMAHIPIIDQEDRADLYALLAKYPNTLSLAGHWHRLEHYFVDESDGWPGETPHHHVVQGTTSGGWWRGPYDPWGVPAATMYDGAPNGYTIFTFDGADYRMEYRAAGYPADFQMHIWAPDAATAGEAADTEVLVNVFNGNERSTVEMRFGPEGAWREMEHHRTMDPFLVKAVERQDRFLEKVATIMEADAGDRDVQQLIEHRFRPVLGRTLVRPRDNSHTWRGTLGAPPRPGYHWIEVRTTDMFGRQYSARRAIQITE